MGIAYSSIVMEVKMIKRLVKLKEKMESKSSSQLIEFCERVEVAFLIFILIYVFLNNTTNSVSSVELAVINPKAFALTIMVATMLSVLVLAPISLRYHFAQRILKNRAIGYDELTKNSESSDLSEEEQENQYE